MYLLQSKSTLNYVGKGTGHTDTVRQRDRYHRTVGYILPCLDHTHLAKSALPAQIANAMRQFVVRDKSENSLLTSRVRSDTSTPRITLITHFSLPKYNPSQISKAGLPPTG